MNDLKVHGVPAIEIPEKDFTSGNTVSMEALKKLIKERFGDIHVCPPIAFKVKGSTSHGTICSECGTVTQWG